MPKIKGPLFSLSAAGQFAKRLIFEHGPHGPYAKRYAKPKRPPTAAQLAHRAQFAQLANAWTAASPADKLTWTQIASQLEITDYDAYTKINWNLLADGQPTTTVYPPPQPEPPNPEPPGVPFIIWPNYEPAIGTWTALPSPPVALAIYQDKVYCEAIDQLTTLNANDFLDGDTIDLTRATALTSLTLTASGLTTAPTITGITALQTINFSSCSMTDYTTVRQFWLDLAANCLTNNGQLLGVTGGNLWPPDADAMQAYNDLVNAGWYIPYT